MHRDICADPVLHGLVLNLYLNGEQYPHRVIDYFPPAENVEPELALAMHSHMQDEDKHIRLYEKAVKKLGQPVLELPLDSVFNHVIRSHTSESFAMQANDGPDEQRWKLANFFAHLHFLETRVAQSLEFHLDACAHSPSDYPAKVVSVVLGDELRHATYTRDAVHALLPRAKACSVMASHARAEATANVELSARELSRLVRENGDRFPHGRRWVYRLCTVFLAQVMNYA
jgi:hypothetical protein